MLQGVPLAVRSPAAADILNNKDVALSRRLLPQLHFGTFVVRGPFNYNGELTAGAGPVYVGAQNHAIAGLHHHIVLHDNFLRASGRDAQDQPQGDGGQCDVQTMRTHRGTFPSELGRSILTGFVVRVILPHSGSSRFPCTGFLAGVLSRPMESSTGCRERGQSNCPGERTRPGDQSSLPRQTQQRNR